MGLHILILSAIYPRRSDPSSGIFVHNQAKYLSNKGCEVAVISPVAVPVIPIRGLATWQHLVGVRHEDTIEGIRVVYPRYLHLPRRIFRQLFFVIYYHSIKNIVQQVIKRFQPDILHTHMATPEGCIGILLRKEFALPLVVSLRGSDINTYAYSSNLMLCLTRRVISEADRVITISHSLKSAAEKIGSPRRQITVIHNGCDTDKFIYSEQARSFLRRKMGISQGSVVLILIGHIIKKNGVLDIIEAFREVVRRQVDPYLILVGHGKDAKLLLQEVSKTRIRERIHFIGTRKHEEIPGWLSMADVLVLPSYGEGLPNVVVEAMACQRPVIATKVGGIPEAVADGKNGVLVGSKDPIALTQAMERLARDEKLRNQMGIVGRQIVLKSFSGVNSTKNLIMVYKSLTS